VHAQCSSNVPCSWHQHKQPLPACVFAPQHICASVLICPLQQCYSRYRRQPDDLDITNRKQVDIHDKICPPPVRSAGAGGVYAAPDEARGEVIPAGGLVQPTTGSITQLARVSTSLESSEDGTLFTFASGKPSAVTVQVISVRYSNAPRFGPEFCKDAFQLVATDCMLCNQWQCTPNTQL
jgi:hypothetical protein